MRSRSASRCRGAERGSTGAPRGSPPLTPPSGSGRGCRGAVAALASVVPERLRERWVEGSEEVGAPAVDVVLADVTQQRVVPCLALGERHGERQK